MNNYEVLATEIGFVSAFATVTYDEAGVLWIDGVPVMPQAFSIETDFAYELYLEFCAGGYEDEPDWGKGER